MKPKKTVFVHIGMPKTATTSIQASLQGYSDGVTRYAMLGPANHSIPLLTAFRKDPSTHLYYRKRGIGKAEAHARGETMLHKLQAELESDESNLILSGEELCRFTASEVARLRRFLQQYSEQLRVLIYVRDPMGFSSSVFQQVARHRELREFSVPMPRYRIWFEKYISVFGRENIDFVSFAAAQLANHCVISDFLARVGVPEERVSKYRKNESLSAEAVALLLDWNQHGIKGSGSVAEVKAMNRLISLLRGEFPGKFRIHREMVLAEMDEADCVWLETQAGFSVLSAEAKAEDFGVRSDSELAEIARQCVPQLRALTGVRGLTVAGDSPAMFMNELFLDLQDRA